MTVIPWMLLVGCAFVIYRQKVEIKCLQDELIEAESWIARRNAVDRSEVGDRVGDT